jgi:glycine betaine/proline transport system permease protein
LVVLAVALRDVGGFPSNWDIDLAAPFDALYDWVLDNQFSHPVFTRFFRPVSDSIEWMLDGLAHQLLVLPWYGTAALAFVVIARAGKWRMAAVAAAAALFPGFVGLWEPTTDTLALMIVSVAIAVVLGVPLGILAALRPGFRSFLRPVLDAMQTIPAPAYLVVAVMVFTTGPVPASVATVIYALPPVVRLTTLGIAGVPPATVEAGQMMGSSRRPVLLKIQLPQAVPSIATGVNQTINMALGLVVIAAFVGAGGLGQEALDMLRSRRTGRGMVVGLAIVAVAIVLDRVSRSFVERPERGSATAVQRRRWWLLAGGVVVAVVVGRIAGWTAFPRDFGLKWADPLDDAVDWIGRTFREQLEWINDTYVREVYIRAVNWVRGDIAWPVFVVLAGMLGTAAKSWRLGLFCALSVVTIGTTGLWAASSETIVQVVLTVLIATAIAVPIGVWAGRRSRVDPVLSPLLDAFQTVPSLTYTIPLVALFGVSVVPGTIASVIYAMSPGIRVTSLGIKGVPEATVEAATTFGATDRQLLRGVRLPLALPAIMLAINQVILMVVAMVIIVGYTGGQGLGYRMIEAFTRQEIGDGVEVALCLTLMAMVLDRLTQALADRSRPPATT